MNQNHPFVCDTLQYHRRELTLPGFVNAHFRERSQTLGEMAHSVVLQLKDEDYIHTLLRLMVWVSDEKTARWALNTFVS